MILSFLFAASVAFAQQFTVPALTGPVVDNAQIIDAQTSAAIEDGLRALRDQTGTQINVLTVDSLGGLSIEQASIQITDKWKLGEEKTDKGVLLLIAKSERKVRIEVGQGLEGSLTDAYSNRIIQDVILPRFKAGDFSDGVLQGVAAIVRYTNPEVDPQSLFGGVRHTSRRSTSGGSSFPVIFFIIVLLFLFFGRGGRGGGRRISPWTAGAIGYGLGRSGGGWGGGGFGGGGGGGGWSGGGGGFSGGGASGGW